LQTISIIIHTLSYLMIHKHCKSYSIIRNLKSKTNTYLPYSKNFYHWPFYVIWWSKPVMLLLLQWAQSMLQSLGHNSCFVKHVGCPDWSSSHLSSHSADGFWNITFIYVMLHLIHAILMVDLPPGKETVYIRHNNVASGIILCVVKKRNWKSFRQGHPSGFMTKIL
jgi:hypothetical protein